MEAEDLVERTKEFQLLRVTKDLQGKMNAHQKAMNTLQQKMHTAAEDAIPKMRKQVETLQENRVKLNQEKAVLT